MKIKGIVVVVLSSFFALSACDKNDAELAPPSEASISIAEATEITHESAVLNGFVADYEESVAITERGFFWGVSDNKDSLSAKGIKEIVEGTSGDMQKQLSGLSPLTTYYYCVFVTNSSGTALSDVQNFTTTIRTYAFDSDENSSQMYQDDELMDSIYEAKWRRFQVANLLRVKPISTDSIEIANFAPVDIADATIIATIEGYDEPIELFKISKIRGHGRQIIRYPFADGQTRFLSTSGKRVDLSVFNKGISSDAISFDFAGETELIKKLRELKKSKWEIIFWDYTGNGGNWSRTFTPKDARRFTGIMINLAYMFVQDYYRAEFVKEYIIGNDGTSSFTNEQKNGVLDDLNNKDFYELGKVSGTTDGLGGGSVFGLAEWILAGYLQYSSGVADITSHELMHTIGYGHSSNLTYSKYIDTDGDGEEEETGINPVTRRVMKKMFEENLFPITSGNYYKQSDFSSDTKSVRIDNRRLTCCEDCLSK
ncbi:MAG: fibronectin type III domain-containing protein [Bacteroidales bacterium]